MRRAGPADLDTVVMLDLVLPEHQVGPPVFSRGPVPTAADVRGDWEEELSDPTFGIFIAELEECLVGSAVGAPAGVSAAHRAGAP